MDLKFNGQERVPAALPKVWAFINDPQRVASCLPEVEDIVVHDPRNFDATVRVAVGPVRGKFKFKIQLDPQADERHMVLKIGGGGFGSVVDLTANAELTDNGDATTTLDWNASATMRGPVATVGGRVLDAQAQRVISTTFANVKAKLTEAA
jgi:carbon monoxide dehydrogenase subunit G